MPWTDWLKYIIPAGASVAGSIIASRAQGSATDKSIAASERAAELERLTSKEALELEKEMYNRGIQMNYPWLQIGSQALTPFGRGMGLPAPEGGYSVPSLASLMLPTGAGTADAGGLGGEGGAGSLGASSGLPPSSTLRPGGTLKPVAGGAFKGATGGAGLLTALGGASALAGPLAPFVIGGGAAIGGLTGLIGRGRKEADQIVPYQEALTREFAAAINRIKSKNVMTPGDWQSEIDRLEPLYSEYQALIERFGRAGPGAERSTAYMGDMLNEWKGYAGASPEGRMHGGPVRGKMMMGGGDYIVGEEGPEILDMAPGSEGYVYPHSSFMAMMKAHGMPGRQLGGPVSDYQKPILPTEVPNQPRTPGLAFQPGTAGIPGGSIGTMPPPASTSATPEDAWKPWGEMSPATQQWVLSRAAGNPAEFSSMSTPGGGTRPMSAAEALQYQQWQNAGGAAGGNLFSPAANRDTLQEQINAWQAGVDPLTRAPAQPTAAPPSLGGPLGPVQPPAGGLARQTPYGPQRRDRLYTQEQNRPSQEFTQGYAPFSPQGGMQRPTSLTSIYGQGLPGRQTGGPVTDTNDPIVGTFRPPRTPVSDWTRIPMSSPPASRDPYGNMAAPYDVLPGEFLQPWQEPLPDPNRPERPLPANVDLRPFEFNAEDVYKDPSYNFRFGEGQKALERLASAGGRSLGGRTLKELLRYGQDFASTEYANAYARALGENQLAYGRDVDQYGRLLNQSDILYGRDEDAYNRLLNQYGMRYDIFKQNQLDRYNRMKALTGIA